eukprot:13462604-Alexandrium_andersonii.AAC.1
MKELDQEFKANAFDKDVAALQKAAEEGFKSRDKLGQTFARSPEGGKSEAYLKLHTHEQKSAFRQAFSYERVARSSQ